MPIEKNAVVGSSKNATVDFDKNAILSPLVYRRAFISTQKENDIYKEYKSGFTRGIKREGSNKAAISLERGVKKNKTAIAGFERFFVISKNSFIDLLRDKSTAKSSTLNLRHDFYIKDNDKIIATNIETGEEIDLGSGVDVAIPDGEYSLDVRTSHAFWVDSRNINKFYLKISGGEVVIASNLPTILNLTYERLEQTTLRFSVSNYANCKVGIWLYPTTPVDTSGEPDASINVLENITNYQYSYSQSSAEYAALACYDGTTVGAIQEIYLPLIPSIVHSPEDQFGQP